MDDITNLLQTVSAEIMQLETQLSEHKARIAEIKHKIKLKTAEFSTLKQQLPPKPQTKPNTSKGRVGRPPKPVEQLSPLTRKRYESIQRREAQAAQYKADPRSNPKVANYVGYIQQYRPKWREEMNNTYASLLQFKQSNPNVTQQELNHFYLTTRKHTNLQERYHQFYECVVKGKWPGTNMLECCLIENQDALSHMQDLINYDLYLHNTFGVPFIYPTVEFTQKPSTRPELPPIPIIPTAFTWPSVFNHQLTLQEPLPMTTSPAIPQPPDTYDQPNSPWNDQPVPSDNPTTKEFPQYEGEDQ